MILDRRSWLAATAALALPSSGCGRETPPPAAEPSPAESPPPGGSGDSATSASPPPSAPPREDDPLAARFPLLASVVPHLALATLPSFVEHADGLGERTGLRNLWIKRDDRFAKLYAGGKIRKLAYYLAEARARGAEELVTLGATGSHQAVAVAAHGRAQGFRVTVLLAPSPMDAEQRQNVLAVAAFGARVELVGGVGEALAAAEKSALRDPKRYVIPPGGSSPLGTVGFVRAGLELAEQARRNALPEPSRVYVPLGTMGSALGLALGLAAAGLRTKVYAVRVSNAATSSEAALARLTKETRAWLEARDPAFRDVRAPTITIVGHQLGRGYALPTAAATKAVDLAAEHGLSLETTYTGKCLAALLDEAPALRDEPVVFWNTHSSVPLPGGEADIANLPGPLAAVLRRPR